MEYERFDQSNLSLMKPIESKTVTLIWSSDGWCYMPQLKMRQRFTETLYFLETWNGVIGLPSSVEQVQLEVYSKEPRIWQEVGGDHREAYRVLTLVPQQEEVLSSKKKTQTNKISVPAKQ